MLPVNRDPGPTPINLNHAKPTIFGERSSRGGKRVERKRRRKRGEGQDGGRMDADKTRNENVEEKRNLGERGRGGRSFCRILGNGRGMWYITKRPYAPFPPHEGRNGRKKRESDQAVRREVEKRRAEVGEGGWRRIQLSTQATVQMQALNV